MVVPRGLPAQPRVLPPYPPPPLGQIRAGKVSSQLNPHVLPPTTATRPSSTSPALPGGHLEMWGRGCQCLDTEVEFSL